MKIDQLRDKHRSSIVCHTVRLYGLEPISVQQQRAFVQFMRCGNIQTLLSALKRKGNEFAAHQHATVPLPVTEVAGSIVVCDSNLTFYAGKSQKIEVVVNNLSKNTWKTEIATPIYISYHWYEENGNLCEYEGCRTALPEPIHPGESRQLSVNVQPLNGVGTYQLEITMVMEEEFWFEQYEFNTYRMNAEILPTKPLSSRTLQVYKMLTNSIKNNTK